MSYNDPVSLDELLDHITDIENASIEENNDVSEIMESSIEFLEKQNEEMEERLDDISDGNVIKEMHHQIKKAESDISSLRFYFKSLKNNTHYREMVIETLEKIKRGI
jgi:uncharacterized membrane protein YcaP (DUF421 family)